MASEFSGRGGGKFQVFHIQPNLASEFSKGGGVPSISKLFTFAKSGLGIFCVSSFVSAMPTMMTHDTDQPLRQPLERRAWLKNPKVYVFQDGHKNGVCRC